MINLLGALSESQSAVGSVTKTVFRVFLDTFEFLAAICVSFLTFFAAVLVYMARAPDTVPPSVVCESKYDVWRHWKCVAGGFFLYD